MWNQLLLSGRNASGFGFGTPTLYQMICICVKYWVVVAAAPGSVVRMIVRQGGIVALAGVTVGLAAAFAGGRLIESLLYGVSPRDPGVLAGTTAVLLCVVLLA